MLRFQSSRFSDFRFQFRRSHDQGGEFINRQTPHSQAHRQVEIQVAEQIGGVTHSLHDQKLTLVLVPVLPTERVLPLALSQQPWRHWQVSGRIHPLQTWSSR